MPQLAQPSLALYVHLPWCVRKCPYCDFNSHEVREDIPRENYLDQLLADLETGLPRVWGRTVSSIYFGGGTPSLFSADQYERLLSGIRARVPVAPDAEITLEANPGTVERDSFSAYRQAGINRVSLGAQSFSPASLKAIGRIHDDEDLHRALDSLAKSGIENFNIDLMFGLPGQSVKGALFDLEQALAAGPAHLSYYQLTIEPNTAFAVSPPVLPGEDDAWDMQERAAALFEPAGFSQYEISAWAIPGQASRHNMNYWQYGDYLGIGAGAHSKVTLAAENRIIRQVRSRHPRQYLAGKFLAQEQEVEGAERIFEFFLNAFRLREGFIPGLFSERTGMAWEMVLPTLETAQGKGLLEPVGDGFRPTSLGWRFVNELQGLFLPENA